MSALRRTPLYASHAAAGGRLVDFAGWEMPLQYTSVRAEEEAVRSHAGLFDVSHMGRFLLRGDGVEAFLQSMVTNDLGRIGDGQAQYNLLCNGDGGVLDDLVVYRGQPWRLVVNAANREADLAWLREHAPAGIAIDDVSADSALIALQGPQAASLLPVSGVDLASVGFFGWTQGTVAGVPEVLISRTGYTGEDGFELFVPAASATAVWDALCAAGATPCGLAARDVCRLEAGLRLHGNDMGPDVNPYEAGLGWVVKLDKGEFSGRAALQGVKAAGPRRRLVGLRGAGRTIPRHGDAVAREGAQIGLVTSGTYSFWLPGGIGMALLEADRVPGDGALELRQRGQEVAAEIAKLPFYRGSAGRA